MKIGKIKFKLLKIKGVYLENTKKIKHILAAACSKKLLPNYCKDTVILLDVRMWKKYLINRFMNINE